MSFAGPPLARLIEGWEEECRNRRCEKALSLLEQALRIRPGDWEVHYRLGVCYSGGCTEHSLVDAEIAVAYFGKSLELCGAPAADPRRAGILDGLGNCYARCRSLPPGTRFRKAIDCHLQAAEAYRRCGQLEEWAREEHNIGNAWCEMPARECPAKWQEAVRHYEQALTVRTKDANPERHAATLQNLGTAYRELPEGDKVANVAKAISCYRRALLVRRPAASAWQNAALHNNLGNAYLSLPVTNEEAGRRNARRALRHLNESLSVRTRADHPFDYAVTQYNRGQAFLLLAASGAAACTQAAVSCFEEARACFDECGAAENAQMAAEWLSTVRSLPAS